MPRPDRAALTWLARAALLVGSVTVALRAGLPAAAVAPRPSADPAPAPSHEAPRGHEAPWGHEAQDMDGRLMARLVLLLGSVAATMVAAMIGLRLWVARAHEQAQPRLTAQQLAHPEPPTPRLQADPYVDIAALRASEAARLGGYAWADAGHTRARIPLTRAMALTIGRTLDPPP